MQEPERRSGCGSPLRAFSSIDCQKTCSPKACHQGIQLSYHIFRARRVCDRSCRCHSSGWACWTGWAGWSRRTYCSGRSLLDPALPPDPALLSLLPDLPGLLLLLLLLLPPGPALLPLQPGLLLRLLLSSRRTYCSGVAPVAPTGPCAPVSPAGPVGPVAPTGPLRSCRSQPDLSDLLLRLLLLDPALLPLRLDLSDLLLPLLLLDQSLLPDLALLSLPPGPAPLSDQSAPAHRHIQEIPADRSVPVALLAPSALLVPLAPGIPADLSAPSDLCSSSFHPAVRSFRRIPHSGIHFHSDFAPPYSRHHDKDHNPYFSYLNLLLLIFHEYSVTGYPFTILYAARPYSFLLSLSLHPPP